MLKLYFLTCLTANSAHCVTRVTYLDEIADTPQRCLAVAQPVMARWSGEHADRWRVTKYRCGQPFRDDGTRI